MALKCTERGEQHLPKLVQLKPAGVNVSLPWQKLKEDCLVGQWYLCRCAPPGAAWAEMERWAQGTATIPYLVPFIQETLRASPES